MNAQKRRSEMCGKRASEQVGAANATKCAFNDFLSGIDINRTLALRCLVAAAPLRKYNIKGKRVLNVAVKINVLPTTPTIAILTTLL